MSIVTEENMKYIEDKSYQIDAIQDGHKAADNNEFASEEELIAFKDKWGIQINP